MPKRTYSPISEPSYEVEFIRKARVTEYEDWEYFIKWGGYPEEDNSWEPESNLAGCRRMLRSFWATVGLLVKGTAAALDVGYEVKAPVLWIQQQSRAYHQSKRKKAQAQKDQKWVSDSDDESSDDASFVAKDLADHSSQSGVDSPPSSRNDDPDAVRSRSNSTHNQQTSSLKRKAGKHDADHQSQVRPAKRNMNEPPLARLSPLFDASDDDTPSALPSQPTPSATPNPPTKSIVPSKSIVPPPSDPTTRSLPAHLQRKLNPRVKPMALPISRSDGLLGISTKARLSGQGAKRPIPSPSFVQPPPAAAAPNPFSAIANGSDAPDLIDLTAPDLGGYTAPEGRPKTAAEPISKESSQEAVAPPPTLNLQSIPRFSKRWRWAGQLAIGDNESESGFAEPIGGVLLTDNTPLVDSAGHLGIHLLIPPSCDSLCLQNPFSLAMLPATLADFKITQYAHMTADQSSEENNFDDLTAYMTKYELYSQTPLFVGGQCVATMFAFPPSLAFLRDELDLPAKFRERHGLVVAIGFQVFQPPQGALGNSIETYRSEWRTGVKLDAPPEGTPSIECLRALLTLSFPGILFKRLAHKECALFTTPVDNDQPGPDTLALSTVLRHVPECKIVPILTGSARFIFIHVGAWSILHRLVGLVDRRLRRQDVQFFTYGSDPAVEPRHWGVQEVFPIGGVVTFTPRAIAEDPEGVQNLISKLNEHPLWACYVLPSVVAMIPEVTAADLEPNSRLKDVYEALCGILMPIEKGEIALTWHPPHSRGWQQTSEGLEPSWVGWMIEQSKLSELRGEGLVSSCRKRLQEESGDRSEKEIEFRIVKDMVVMQSELRYVYRRFVIITDRTGTRNTSREAATSMTASKADVKDVFEFTHVNEFTFGDDFTFST